MSTSDSLNQVEPEQVRMRLRMEPFGMFTGLTHSIIHTKQPFKNDFLPSNLMSTMKVIYQTRLLLLVHSLLVKNI